MLRFLKIREGVESRRWWSAKDVAKGHSEFFFPWKFANQVVQKICSSALDVEVMIKNVLVS